MPSTMPAFPLSNPWPALSARAAYGNDHPEVAITLTNLGNVHQARGDLVAARSCWTHAEAVFIAAYGRNHHYVAHTRRLLDDLGE